MQHCLNVCFLMSGYAVLGDVPPWMEGDTRIDEWWAQLQKKLPALSKIALAALTIFHGPKVCILGR